MEEGERDGDDELAEEKKEKKEKKTRKKKEGGEDGSTKIDEAKSDEIMFNA
jgi:hypothetical protein